MATPKDKLQGPPRPRCLRCIHFSQREDVVPPKHLAAGLGHCDLHPAHTFVSPGAGVWCRHRAFALKHPIVRKEPDA